MLRILYPNIVLFHLSPKIALAPLFIIWLAKSNGTSGLRRRLHRFFHERHLHPGLG